MPRANPVTGSPVGFKVSVTKEGAPVLVRWFVDPREVTKYTLDVLMNPESAGAKVTTEVVS